MKTSITIGTITAITALFIGFISQNMQLTLTITSWIGIISLVVAILLSGSFISGDQILANHAAETKETKESRNKTTVNALLIAIPNLATAIICYTLFS